jgi:hypothetical protein
MVKKKAQELSEKDLNKWRKYQLDVIHDWLQFQLQDVNKLRKELENEVQ